MNGFKEVQHNFIKTMKAILSGPDFMVLALAGVLQGCRNSASYYYEFVTIRTRSNKC